MFADTKAYSGFAVPDLEAARRFYGETLGLRTSVPMEGVLLALHLAEDRDTLIYQKPDHESANYTILNFEVDDVERAVDELSSRGVRFERYEGSGRTRRASPAARGPRSRGSPTRRGTSWPCTRGCSAASHRMPTSALFRPRHPPECCSCGNGALKGPAVTRCAKQ